MSECKPVSTPVATKSQVSSSNSTPFTNPTLYRKLAGALQYLTITRPDIAYAVNQVCQYMHQPLHMHYQRITRILRYLKGTTHFGLPISCGSPQLTAFSDSDWAGDQTDRKSTTGYGVFFGGNLVLWKVQKQQTVSRSSTEAEYRAIAAVTTEITTFFCGDPVNPHLVLLGICSTSAFVSMWMHNTPAAVMMIPVATGILQRFPTGEEAHPDVKKFCKGVILGVIYGVAIGGMSTLTGTGVNLILVGMWESSFPEEKPISFSSWFLFGFPLALLIFFALWGILCLFYCSKGSAKVLSSYLDREHLKKELESLGPMAFAEKMVLAVFGGLVLLWMTRSLTNDVPGWGALFDGKVGDGTVSVMMATLLFVIPSKKKEGEKLMDWNKCKKLHWNIILLLGAGFAIADGVRTSGLANVLSENLNFLHAAPYLAVAPLVCLVSATITEFTSNNSTTTLVIPVLIELARSMKLHPLLLMVPGAIGAQFAFFLPTGTPSNIVGFTTGHIEIKDMIRTGIPLKIAGIAALSLLMPTLGALVFETSKKV